MLVVVSVFTFKLEFEALFESILQVVADLWQRKGKINSSFKTMSPSVALHQYQISVNFQRKSSNVVCNFF